MYAENEIYQRTSDKQIVYLKNVISNPDIEVEDYTNPAILKRIMYFIIISSKVIS